MPRTRSRRSIPTMPALRSATASPAAPTPSRFSIDAGDRRADLYRHSRLRAAGRRRRRQCLRDHRPGEQRRRFARPRRCISPSPTSTRRRGSSRTAAAPRRRSASTKARPRSRRWSRSTAKVAGHLLDHRRPRRRLFAIDAVTGALSLVAAPDYEAPIERRGQFLHRDRRRRATATLSSWQSVQVLITNVNEGLSITSGSAFSIVENGSAVTVVTASDVDGTAPVYSIAGGADAALFAIDSATGALSFLSAPNYEAPGDAGGDNVYDVDRRRERRRISATRGHSRSRSPTPTTWRRSSPCTATASPGTSRRISPGCSTSERAMPRPTR